MGSVTAPENVRWSIPVRAWFALVVWVQLQKSSPQVLSVTFFFVFIASGVPFFFSPVRFRLASSRDMRGCRDSDLSKRLSFIMRSSIRSDVWPQPAVATSVLSCRAKSRNL